ALQRSQACLEMLRLLLHDRPKALNLLTRVQRAQDDLQHLYEEVRSYSAPIVLQRQPCRLGDILQEAWAHLADQRNGRNVQLRDGCSGSNADCEVDRILMARVFENILENALAACPDPVEIAVTCDETHWHRQRAFRLTIHDNGPGLNGEQQQKIFEPFYTTKTRGTGLGMAIARRIVEAHEGRIEAANEPAGGAVIIITLPRGKP
ncbi:MAG TPA: ATP-binding protein, partial [Gemmataceae bacterium]|nr:ATP-binding protein [Gemmataceae bacterium]